MSEFVIAALEKRLRDKGLSGGAASKLAQIVVEDFQRASGQALPDLAAVERNLDQAVFAIVTMQLCVQDCFRQAAKMPLPETAPALWKNKADRLPGETPVQFLRRVWGPYIDAGVLYQDDVKRLGDPKLLQNVRGHCRYHGLDPYEYLPPPHYKRIDRLINEVIPDSPVARIYRSRLLARPSMRRKLAPK